MTSQPQRPTDANQTQQHNKKQSSRKDPQTTLHRVRAFSQKPKPKPKPSPVVRTKETTPIPMWKTPKTGVPINQPQSSDLFLPIHHNTHTHTHTPVLLACCLEHSCVCTRLHLSLSLSISISISHIHVLSLSSLFFPQIPNQIIHKFIYIILSLSLPTPPSPSLVSRFV